MVTSGANIVGGCITAETFLLLGDESGFSFNELFDPDGELNSVIVRLNGPFRASPLRELWPSLRLPTGLHGVPNLENVPENTFRGLLGIS